MGDIGVEPPAMPAGDVAIHGDTTDELQCTICLASKFTQEGRISNCNHSFCFSCISEWVCQSLRPSCPMCRSEVDKICYDFKEAENGRIEIQILEYRSAHVQLTQTDKNVLISERRIVVRNIMHAYKVLAALASAVLEIKGDTEIHAQLRKALADLESVVTQHIARCEIMLTDLRLEVTRKNKALIFRAETFRRMIYTKKIRVKYNDQKRPKLQPEDLAKDPERFKNIVTEYMKTEYDAIPFCMQAKPGGVKWRTKFIGQTMTEEDKGLATARIYQLMLNLRPGNDAFQKELADILPHVSTQFLPLLDDHLEAILTVEKTVLDQFYQEVFYDSVYNNISSGFMEYNGMREEPEQLESIFHHFAHFGGGWPPDHFTERRLHRQTSNTDRTDRATNNDDMSDRSESPQEEREATPMPDDLNLSPEETLTRVFESARYPNIGPLRVPGFLDLREPVSEAHRQFREQMELRRRNRLEEAETSRTLSHEDQRLRSSTRNREASERIRRLDAQSEQFSSLMRTRPLLINHRDRRMLTFAPQPIANLTAPLGARPPVYIPSTNYFRAAAASLASLSHSVPPSSHSFTNWPMEEERNITDQQRNVLMRRMMEGMEGMTASANAAAQRAEAEASREPILVDLTRNNVTGTRPPGYIESPLPPGREPTASGERSLRAIAAALDREDAANGLDYISVAHRTRSARRAAASGQLPGAPPPKRAPNSRRDRR
ncbi:unnamed protein product [Caenorhabditis sp. 36 PRJEB53466]|nr:unnamed protein product [Caenorhabditis sp. 36 PRJEB53466]